MHARFELLLTALFLVAAVSIPAQTPPGAVLSIPGSLAALAATEVGELSHGKIDELTVALHQPRTAIRPGSVRVVVNGGVVPSTVRDSRTAGGMVALAVLTGTAAAPLSAGLNTVEVTYERPYVGSVSTYFLLQVGSSGPPPPVTGGSMTRRAVVIGIARYKFAGSGLQNLAYADRDATAMRAALASPAGGAVALAPECALINEDATLANLRAAFSRCLGGSRPGDQVFIFFAGQLMPDPVTLKEFFVVAHDSRPGAFDTTALPLREIESLYANTLAGRVAVTFLDAGRRREEGGVGFEHTTRANDLWLRLATAAGGAAFAAAAPTQISAERSEFDGGHGLLGYIVPRGINGDADADVDGTVTIAELASYVRRQFAVHADGPLKIRQTPVLALNKLDQVAIAGRRSGSAGPR